VEEKGKMVGAGHAAPEIPWIVRMSSFLKTMRQGSSFAALLHKELPTGLKIGRLVSQAVSKMTVGGQDRANGRLLNGAGPTNRR